MNFLVELFLIVILLLLVYNKPTSLAHLVNSAGSLGKVVMIVIVIVIAKTRGLTGGLLAALILVLLLHSSKEDFTIARKKSGKPLACASDADCGACLCRSKCEAAGGRNKCAMEYVESPYRAGTHARMVNKGPGGCGGAPYLHSQGGWGEAGFLRPEGTISECAADCLATPACIKVQNEAKAAGVSGPCYYSSSASNVQSHEPNGNPDWNCRFKESWRENMQNRIPISTTNRIDQENMINRRAEEATISASKFENGQTSA